MTTPLALRRSHRLALLGGAALVAVVLGACIPPRGTPPILTTTTTTTRAGSITALLESPFSPIVLTETATPGTFEVGITVSIENNTGSPINIGTGRAVLTEAPAGMTITDTTPVGTGCYVDTADGAICIHAYKLTWVGPAIGTNAQLTLTMETNGFSDGVAFGVFAGATP